MAGTFQVIVTPPAQRDLKNIVEYLTECESYDRAVKVRDQILDIIEGLEEMPDRHAPLKETYDAVGNHYRRSLTGKYKVIFTIEEPASKVFVVNIMHIKRGPNFVKNKLL